MTRIDGKEATEIAYARRQQEGLSRFDIRFTRGDRIVANIEGLELDDLDAAVGEANARTIAKTAAGELRGEALVNDYGLSPEESTRHVEEKELRKSAEYERMRGSERPTCDAGAEHDPCPAVESSGGGAAAAERYLRAARERASARSLQPRWRSRKIDVPRRSSWSGWTCLRCDALSAFGALIVSPREARGRAKGLMRI